MKSKKAFTLIELLIVIAIIGILAAALYPTIRDAIARGRDGGREGDLNNLATSIEAFNADYGTYPTDSGCIGLATEEVFLDPTDGTTSVIKDYFKGGQAPTDPSQNRTTGEAGTANDCVEAGHYYYHYFGGTGGVEFIIATVMESERNNNYDSQPESFDPDTYTLDGTKFYVKVF